MNTITYRPLTASDHAAAKTMIDEAFQIHRYATTPGVLAAVLEVYLRDCLAASTYSRVAVRDGKAVGLILGRAEGQPPLPGRLQHRLASRAGMAWIALTGRRDRNSLGSHFAFARIYRDLKRRVTDITDDELTLFVVDPAARGAGVGRNLYEHFVQYLHASGRDRFHLFTDTGCTYGFYDRMGLVCASAVIHPMHIGGAVEEMGVFLYTGEVARRESEHSRGATAPPKPATEGHGEHGDAGASCDTRRHAAVGVRPSP